MTEKSFYPALQECMKKNLKGNNAVELKLTKTNKFYLNKMEPHQVPWLYAAKHRRVTYKIPDVGYDRKPCDIIMLSGCNAYVAVLYYIPHKKKHVYFIDVDVFLLWEKSGKVSLAEDEARSISEYHYDL